MSSIADSNAYRDDDRVLPQHQAALTLLQSILANPKISLVKWLDLACGRGQIISSLEKNLSVNARKKIQYEGYDIRHDFTKETAKTASSLCLNSYNVKVGDLSAFSKLYDPDTHFDFITFTNTVHEITPMALSEILTNCVARLSDIGCLFIYDMETLNRPELGALPWVKEEVALIIRSLCQGFGINNYTPEIGQWGHTSCNAWSVQIQRQHLSLSVEDIAANYERAMKQTADSIMKLIQQKFMHCRESLESLTTFGAETAEEQTEKQRLLYDFWALSRALEISQ